MWTWTNHGLVLLLWRLHHKKIRLKDLREMNFLWRNKWNYKSHNFRILRNSAKGKEDCKNWDRYFSLPLFEVCYERNENFLFLHKNFLRSRRSQRFLQKTVLKNFAIFTGKHLCWSFFNIVAGVKTCSFIKKILQHRCFPVNIAKLLRTPFLQNTSGDSSVPWIDGFSMFTLFT